VGLEEAFWQAEQNYDVNCLFVMAIASHESANGTMCFRPNNMFGFGTSGFSSKAECIDVVSRALANNYLSTSGSLYSGKTISSVNKRYAASTTWDDKVARNMTRYYSVISQHHNAALEKLK
ncbi:MAG: glucosaminidase domain-containing protein, partial [Clostridiales bacterium]|nr:glucosaminidase domain-containing protein [Clostridiales bacterium]